MRDQSSPKMASVHFIFEKKVLAAKKEKSQKRLEFIRSSLILFLMLSPFILAMLIAFAQKEGLSFPFKEFILSGK